MSLPAMRRWSYGIVLLGAASLIGCATVPEPDYAEISARYDSLKKEQPERVRLEIEAACNDQGECIVRETALERATLVVTKLNDSVEQWVKAYNSQIDALKECQYGKEQRDATIEYQDKELFRERLIGIGRQVVLAGVCGLLLW